MRLLLAISAILLTTPAVASAHGGGGGYQVPNQYPADREVREVAEDALGYWRQKGRTDCPDGVVVWQAPVLGDHAAGLGGDCEAWINEPFALTIIAPPVDLYKASAACALVVHEIGHAVGLGHEGHGVMASNNGTHIPLLCRRWAQSEVSSTLRWMGWSKRKIQRWITAEKKHLRWR